eukprot:4453935-Alexandrium_andersonii.AAC.1
METIANEAMSMLKKPGGAESKIYMAYKEIYIDGTDEVRQNSALLDYCHEFPEGSVKQGRKRGSAETALVRHAVKFRKIQQVREEDELLDYEAFVIRMHTVRRWKEAQ